MHKSRLAALILDSQIDDLNEGKEKFIVMEAPTGHRFCVVNPQRDDFDKSDQVNAWD